jgi:hypothetical protein
VDVPAGAYALAPLLALALAGVAVVGWLAIEPRTPDLAAQVYRLDAFRRLGFAVWDEHWYAGHDVPGYSLLYGPLAWLLGMRLLAAASLLASVALFQRLAGRAYGRAAYWAAAWFALAAAGDLWIGRLTFALGVPLGLAAALALSRQRRSLAAGLAAACAAASPVAGALLVLAGLTDALARRARSPVLFLAAPAAAVTVATSLLFPEGGTEPFPTVSFVATIAVVLTFMWALPGDQRRLRIGALCYLLACVLCLLVRSPMGSNIERYAVLLCGPLLLCTRAGASRPRVAIALVAAALFAVWGPVRETAAVAGDPSTSASYYAPLERFLERRPAPVRVEVPLTRSHWEAALLAPRVSLARGWEKQLDERFDGVLLARGLTAGEYDRWLHAMAIAYVALPDAPADPSSAQEGRLIRAGLPFLSEVFASRHWRVFAVRAPTPLASGPGRLTSLGTGSFALRASSAGRFLVRVHYSSYLELVRGSGCVGRARDGWTWVRTSAPGTVTVAARLSLAGALGRARSCRPDGVA